MKKNKWNEPMVAALIELYPVETTAHTAALLGMSETSVKMKAKALGLTKLAKTVWMERADHIQNHFYEHSFAEMARALNITKTTVGRIAQKLGLYRTKCECYRVSSRVRLDMIRRERRRILFGLPPVTAIKVVSNRARVRLRSVLKSKGYIVGAERNMMLYPPTLIRQFRLEEKGAKVGLCFYPLQENEETELSTAI
ncbi:MAG: MarR family transcriptional regulator [Prevotella sp.]|uniref:MarR family transcriptional regulator n=1 Tax=Prevotella sp. TaxID=59823 RepID=UPI002A80ECC6|nr:MarR family transcriptional regulator [Prevotella sp.]MDY4020120.1 MarR family transcriptional regulator [Prevotella sp.]